MKQLEWGTVSALIQAIVTVATTIAATVMYFVRRRQRKLNEELERRSKETETRLRELEIQNRQLTDHLRMRDLETQNALHEVELKERRAATFDKIADQAKQVTSGMFTAEDGRQQCYVMNGSTAPIFDLEVRVYGWGHDERYTHYLPKIQSGERYNARFPAGDARGCEVRFRDSRAQGWQLDAHGRLTPLDEYFPRASVVPPGFFDDK